MQSQTKTRPRGLWITVFPILGLAPIPKPPHNLQGITIVTSRRNLVAACQRVSRLVIPIILGFQALQIGMTFGLHIAQAIFVQTKER